MRVITSQVVNGDRNDLGPLELQDAFVVSYSTILHREIAMVSNFVAFG